MKMNKDEMHRYAYLKYHRAKCWNKESQSYYNQTIDTSWNKQKDDACKVSKEVCREVSKEMINDQQILMNIKWTRLRRKKKKFNQE